MEQQRKNDIKLKIKINKDKKRGGREEDEGREENERD